MNPKHLYTLELHKILDQLAAHASFSAGQALAHDLLPATEHGEIRYRLETTAEARALLEVKTNATLGGARDLRPLLDAARRSKTLAPADLLDVRDTLVAGRNLHRILTRLSNQFPHLAAIAGRIDYCPADIEEISRCISDQGDVRDSASDELARIRREVGQANDRLQAKLEAIVHSSDNAKYLQETIVTQREGRYVIPLKAEFKGRIPGVVHDVSASGATIFIEPLSVVELNNAWRELLIQEEQEVKRILAALSERVGRHAEPIERTVEALADLDLAFAKAKYAEALDAAMPEIIPPRNGAVIRYLGARHPLLDPEAVVPIDVVLDDETHALIITGPNTGGKTVSLKTVGLLTLMAQAGLHIPAEDGSAFTPFEDVYADIGDEQSIEQNLSTFSSHLTNILSFLDQADDRSLVLLDELGAGTDPAEGSALARSLMEHFRQHGSALFVATHYPELKSYAQLTPGVRNASVEFDAKTLSPTYRLTIGLPGRSNAFAIAQRLGMPDAIVDAAREMVSPEEQRTEDMLAEIHDLRLQANQARDDAAAARAEAEQTSRELRERLAGIDEERQEILRQARGQATEELETLRTEARRLRQSLRAAAAPIDSVKALEAEIEALTDEMVEPEALEAPPVVESGGQPIRPGDRVLVRPLGVKGEVTAIEDDEIEVQAGLGRTRVRRDEVERVEPMAEAMREPQTGGVSAPKPASPGSRIDLRGCTVDQALDQLDEYLDTAFRAGLPSARIIHGKGTGTLRRAVRRFLADHPLVAEYAGASPRDGGEGVTETKLVQA